ncbi:MAG: hypothetical protein HC919_09840 [Oscillatoriales cyanobacterium SM2_2_1]|nr:hypothetical protein [Oscillatoriales cyanobacterium SM2_2_1]
MLLLSSIKLQLAKCEFCLTRTEIGHNWKLPVKPVRLVLLMTQIGRKMAVDSTGSHRWEMALTLVFENEEPGRYPVVLPLLFPARKVPKHSILNLPLLNVTGGLILSQQPTDG